MSQEGTFDVCLEQGLEQYLTTFEGEMKVHLEKIKAGLKDVFETKLDRFSQLYMRSGTQHVRHKVVLPKADVNASAAKPQIIQHVAEGECPQEAVVQNEHDLDQTAPFKHALDVSVDDNRAEKLGPPPGFPDLQVSPYVNMTQDQDETATCVDHQNLEDEAEPVNDAKVPESPDRLRFIL